MSNGVVARLTEGAIMAEFLPVEKRMVELNMNHLMRMKEKEPKLNASDFFDFIRKAQVTGADPMLDQIYLVPQRQNVYNPATGQKEWKTFGCTIFSYHFFMSKADALKVDGETVYDGYETEDGIGEYMCPVTGDISRKAFAETRVYRKDKTRPTVYKAWFPEFAKFKSDGTLNAQWKKSPMGMLRKCSLCNALKLAFPNELAQMEVSGVDDVSAQRVNLSQEGDIETEAKGASNEKPEFVMTFPQDLAGMKISEVPRDRLAKLLELTDKGIKDKDGGQVSPEVQAFYAAAKKYLGK